MSLRGWTESLCSPPGGKLAWAFSGSWKEVVMLREGEQGALVLGAAHGLWALQDGEEGDENKGENIK